MARFFNAGEIIQFAIRIEENGEAFYGLMAKKIETKEIKELFSYLAGEEVKHRRIFEELASKVEKYQPPESYPDEYFAYLKAYADGHIFTQEKKGELMAEKIGAANEAVEFAIGRELDSILYYLEAKNFVPEGQKGIIDKIVEEERRHYLKLLGVKKNILI